MKLNENSAVARRRSALHHRNQRERVWELVQQFPGLDRDAYREMAFKTLGINRNSFNIRWKELRDTRSVVLSEKDMDENGNPVDLFVVGDYPPARLPPRTEPNPEVVLLKMARLGHILVVNDALTGQYNHYIKKAIKRGAAIRYTQDPSKVIGLLVEKEVGP
jgi:hypothetical protein